MTANNIRKSTVQLDDQTIRTVWRGLGSYIAKTLMNGKGVIIPKFGNFTFTGIDVDLAVSKTLFFNLWCVQGSTNPQKRDKQYREPVFLIANDFANSKIRRGIAHTTGEVRPFDVKGQSGIIPQVKLNYVEVGLFCNLDKDTCKDGCEQVFRHMEDAARAGKQISHEIPLVGRFLVRSRIAAIAFNRDLAT